MPEWEVRLEGVMQLGKSASHSRITETIALQETGGMFRKSARRTHAHTHTNTHSHTLTGLEENSSRGREGVRGLPTLQQTYPAAFPTETPL